MDFKQIQELIKIINKSNIGEITIEDNDFKITIKQKEEKAETIVTAPVASSVASPIYTPVPVASVTSTPVAVPPSPVVSESAKDNLITIKSPMIGTFYRKSSPDKAAFVEVGDEVSPGKVVCIIEAMKLFNEVESEVSGKIAKVLVDNASPVEYDQPLFLVEPI